MPTIQSDETQEHVMSVFLLHLDMWAAGHYLIWVDMKMQFFYILYDMQVSKLCRQLLA